MGTRKVFFRMPDNLFEKVDAAAKVNDWDMSKQIRATLEMVYGVQPYIPNPFQNPTQELPSRKDNKGPRAA